MSELEKGGREVGGEGEGGLRRSVATCGLLRTELGRVRREMESEREVEKDLTDKLKVSIIFM